MSNTNSSNSSKPVRARSTSWDVTKSAWWYRLGDGNSSVAMNLFTILNQPMFVVYMLWPVFYVTAYFASPFNIILKTGILPFEGLNYYGLFIVYLLHVLFVWQTLVYFANVLFMVPWEDIQSPMVESVKSFVPLHINAMHYGMFALIALYVDQKQSFHIWIIGMEGLVLAYLHFGQPCFGFNSWKRSDDKNQTSENKTSSAQTTSAFASSTATAASTDDAIYKTPVQARYANLKFSSIYGMQAIKDKLLAPARAILANVRVHGDAPRNGFLLFGEPGNGKTVFAEALAGELEVPFLELTYGAVSSQWVGNMPKVISNTFAYARRSSPCVFFIDEIDSFIKSRDAAGASNESLHITNTLLTEIVGLRGSKVILIGATNFFANLDAAAVREGRFDYKIEITPPDEAARIGLIQAGVRKYGVGLEVDPEQSLSVAKRWHGFSVARIMAICKALPEVAEKAGHVQIRLEQWMAALREVQGRSGKLPENTKSLSELVLEPGTKNALALISTRLKDVGRIEAMGGTLPTGVLFHGPSGTGKTAAARALAKEVGWAFLSVAGPDLLSDRTKLESLFAEAKDIRPTIIFIDEADDILRNRQYSSTPDMVNKLLVLMDGAEDRVGDVVWVAATNNPDQIEPALLRSGRFTEKVLFTPPPQDQVPGHISMWLKKKDVSLENALDNFDVAEMLAGQTIADIEGVLQYALNCAIESCSENSRPVIKQEDMNRALSVVLNIENI